VPAPCAEFMDVHAPVSADAVTAAAALMMKSRRAADGRLGVVTARAQA
jgi:hypothetical protein